MRVTLSIIIPAATLLFTFVAGLPSASGQPAPANRFKNHLLVVYNSANPESSGLAQYYAKKRNIPDDHILGVRAAEAEEITRDQFNEQIRDPIDTYLVNKGWMIRQPGHSPFGEQQLPVMAATTNEIYIIVLMYGLPLKIANDPNLKDSVANAALSTNAASVDSELTLLPFQGLPVNGPLPNPYQLVSYDRAFDSLDAKYMIMVTRLDAPSPDDVRRMIDDAIFAEKSRLVGNVFIDARGITDQKSGYFEGDQWLRKGSTLLFKHGFHTELDDHPELFANNLPWTNVALYAGWYTTDATGPFMRTSRTFSKGAIAYHINSFSASTLHSPTSNWCGPLIHQGAAATMGAVYEPYLDFMPQWDTFVDRLLRGYTFAEAAYASTKCLSWMPVFVGDPLYTPFQGSVEETLKACEDRPSMRRDFLRLQLARTSLAKGDYGEAKNLSERAIAEQGATFVAWEGYAEIMSDPNLQPPNSTVAQAYEKAFNLSITVEDQMRTGLECAQAYEDRFRPQDSKRILSLLLARYTNEAVYYGVEAKFRQLNGNSPVGTLPPAVPDGTLHPSISGPAVPPLSGGH